MILIKLQSNFTEIRLQHGCSSVNLLHVLRTLLLRKPLVGCFCYMQYMNLCFQPQWDLRCSKSLTQRWKGVLNNNNFTKISGKLYKRILQNTVLWFYLKLLIPGGNKSLHIQSECGKIRTWKSSVFGHFSHSACNKSSKTIKWLSARLSTT